MTRTETELLNLLDEISELVEQNNRADSYCTLVLIEDLLVNNDTWSELSCQRKEVTK